jgi:hypothetical protein
MIYGNIKKCLILIKRLITEWNSLRKRNGNNNEFLLKRQLNEMRRNYKVEVKNFFENERQEVKSSVFK